MGVKKRRLCIILPPHWSWLMGGSQYQMKCLLEQNILQKEFDVYVLCRKIGTVQGHQNYRLIKIVRSFGLQRYGGFMDAPFLWNKLKAISPDVIYQRMATSHAGVATYYARKTGCKMVLHIASDNDITPLNKIRQRNFLIQNFERKLFNYAIRNTHQLIVQTHGQKKLVKKHFKKETDAVIANFQPYPKETIDKKFPVKIVWIANFKVIKQPEIFIRVAESLYKQGVAAQCIMIGSPATKYDKCFQDWQKLLEDKIDRIPTLTYLGGRTTEEVEQILAESHILVNTSQYEGFSNTFIQAWMRNVPVISLNSNPNDLLSDGKIGLLSGSYEQLRKDLIRLVNNHNLREAMGKEAKAYSYKHFSMRNTNDILKVLSF
jgi:glycosyltransferase involved in cell wall biosynthesis